MKDEIKKVLLLGSGALKIGEAGEFDYSGSQALKALKEEGIETVLINPNIATVQTSEGVADQIYFLPVTPYFVEKVIEKERPDGVLLSFGGQTALNCGVALYKAGIFEKYNVRVLGTPVQAIMDTEDRELFVEKLNEINVKTIKSEAVENLEDARRAAKELGYPVIIRAAYALGGLGSGFCDNEEELNVLAEKAFSFSPQVLVEKSLKGWKEVEYEVVRDRYDNCITVCNMENFDPLGIHTGESIVIAPSQTLTNAEYHKLRELAIRIIRHIGIVGECNVQYAFDPESEDYRVIEVNARLSRSSALASKATGYPLAFVAAKLGLGYGLFDLKNSVTKTTSAFFEPALDYVVCKIPRWDLGKFHGVDRELGSSMKSVGEVMAIGRTFEEAIQKGLRMIGQGMHGFVENKELVIEDVDKALREPTDKRIFVISKAMRAGYTVDQIHELTKIDKWFLQKLQHIMDTSKEMHEWGNNHKQITDMPDELLRKAKVQGFSDFQIARAIGYEGDMEDGILYVRNHRKQVGILPVVKQIDTLAAEYPAQTNYLYLTYSGVANDVKYLGDHKSIVVLGSGAYRIGSSVEFDWCGVQALQTIRKEGYRSVMINYNPETVSTDFDTADRLYFEPLTTEDVMGIIKTEKPFGVVVAFGGQTAIKLTKFLSDNGVNILGTSYDAIDMAEDRERFDELLEKYQIKRPKGVTVMTTEEALEVASKIGYPVLLRPSYVLGGQNMIIAFNEDDVKEYMAIILAQNIENPILIDKYLMGTEIEVDAICDGEDILIPGIMEHIERAGVHSGDSIAVYPAWNLSDKMTQIIIESSKNLAIELKTKGLVNIQYLIYKDELYVIEVNPRSSRTIPYISKVTGVPMVDLATRAMLGEKLRDMGYGTGLYRKSPYIAVKVPVFSFEKLINVDNHLGPEMKSTGEVLGIAATLEEALYKGLIGAGYKMKKKGGVFITVRNSDKAEIGEIAKKYYDLGFTIYATEGTAEVLKKFGIDAVGVKKIHESNTSNTLTLIESGKIQYVISTSAKGRIPSRDSVKIRRKTVERNIPCLTSLDTANALADCLKSHYSQHSTELIDINNMREEKLMLKFTKMQGIGNDYIYFSTFDQEINNPEALAVRLSDRHFGIGGDGVILVCPSKVADAKMKMYNRDGSEGKMCGNGIRCVGKFLYDHGMIDYNEKDEITIETLSGIKSLKAFTTDGKVTRLRVDMGKAILDPKEIPVAIDKDKVVNEAVKIGDKEYNITCVSMGNPHCVVFMDDIDNLDIEKVGPEFEFDKLFPERVNTEFVTVLDEHTIKMRVWERGSGETWACGTGACAVAVAACENGFCKKGEDIKIKLIGGDLIINYTDETVYMTGNAEKVFDGEVEV